MYPSRLSFCLAAVLTLLAPISLIAQDFRVLPPRTDIPVSPVYKASVSDSANGTFVPTHMHYSEPGHGDDDYGYETATEGWHMSYANFEFRNSGCFVKLEKIGGDIPDLEVRPNAKNVSVTYRQENGRRVAVLGIQAPINDYFKTSYLGICAIDPSTGEPDITDAIGIFANPYQEEPTNNVIVINPGDSIPQPGNIADGKTLVFKPGTHNVGLEYGLKSDVNYHFANGAYVKGTFVQYQGKRLFNSRITGYGIVSTAHVKRYGSGGKLLYTPMKLVDTVNVEINGPTYEDASHHTVRVGTNNVSLAPSAIRFIKCVGWRHNSDGPNVVGNSVIEDVFVRTQDDTTYLSNQHDGAQFRRMVIWNDINGSSFIFTARKGGGNTYVEDCDVLYNRIETYIPRPQFGLGGSVFCMRGLGTNERAHDVTIENVRIDDENMDRGIFYLRCQPSPRETGASGYTFENITFRHITSVTAGGKKSALMGEDANHYPENIRFECVKYAGKFLTDLDDLFYTENIVRSEITIDNSHCQDNQDTTPPSAPSGLTAAPIQ